MGAEAQVESHAATTMRRRPCANSTVIRGEHPEGIKAPFPQHFKDAIRPGGERTIKKPHLEQRWGLSTSRAPARAGAWAQV